MLFLLPEGNGGLKEDVDTDWRTRFNSEWRPSSGGFLRGVPRLSRSLSFYAVAALVTLTVITVVPAGHNAQITYSGTDPFPVGLFGGIPIPNPSLTYSMPGNGEVLQFSNGTGPPGPVPTNFSRDLSGQSLTASFEMSIPETGNSTFLDPIANLGSMTVFFVGQVSLPSSVFTIVPFHEENLTNYSAVVPIARSQPLVLSNLSGDSIRQYEINLTSFQFDTLGLFFNPTAVSYTQNLLFYAQLPSETLELFIIEGILYFAVLAPGQPWVLYPETALNGPLSGPYLLALAALQRTTHSARVLLGRTDGSCDSAGPKLQHATECWGVSPEQPVLSYVRFHWPSLLANRLPDIAIRFHVRD